MESSGCLSSYVRLKAWQARAVLLALAALTVFCLATAPPPPKIVNVAEEGSTTGDVALYRAEVDRIHAGEDYYQVAAEELVARNYPTRSVFNWRTPLPMWLIGKMQAVVFGKILLCGLALTVLVLAFQATCRENPVVLQRALPLVVLLVGPLLPCLLGDLFVMPVLWAGVLICLSIAAYGVDRPRLGLAAGLAAVFFRELAMPYCLVAAVLAWRQRRRGELIGWAVGLAAWAVLFSLHAWRVSQLIGPDAAAHRGGWVQFGGTTFILSTVQANACLLLAPGWVTILYFVAAMVGLGGWNTPMGLRTTLTVCVFTVAFAVIGQPFNSYWGMLIAPLFTFGVVRAPGALIDLWHAAARLRVRSNLPLEPQFSPPC